MPDQAVPELTFEDAIDLLLTLLPSDATDILLRAGPHELERHQGAFADQLRAVIPLEDDDLMELCGVEDSFTAESTLIHAAWTRARNKRVH